MRCARAILLLVYSLTGPGRNWFLILKYCIPPRQLHLQCTNPVLTCGCTYSPHQQPCKLCGVRLLAPSFQINQARASLLLLLLCTGHNAC